MQTSQTCFDEKPDELVERLFDEGGVELGALFLALSVSEVVAVTGARSRFGVPLVELGVIAGTGVLTTDIDELLPFELLFVKVVLVGGLLVVVKSPAGRSRILCVSMCCFMLPFVEKPRSQTSHLKGRSLV